MTNSVAENPDTSDLMQIRCRVRRKRKIVLVLIGIGLTPLFFYLFAVLYRVLHLSDPLEIVLLLAYAFIFVVVFFSLIGTMISKRKFKKDGWDQISVTFIRRSHTTRRYGKTYTIELLFDNGSTEAKTIDIGDIINRTLMITGTNKEILKLCDFRDEQTYLSIGETKVTLEVTADKGADIADIHLFNSGMRPVTADISGHTGRGDGSSATKDHKYAAKTHSMGRLWTVFIVLVIVGMVFLQYKLNILGL